MIWAIMPLAFAQNLLWGTPTAPWTPAPTSAAEKPSRTFPAIAFGLFHLPSALRVQLKNQSSTLQFTVCLLVFCVLAHWISRSSKASSLLLPGLCMGYSPGLGGPSVPSFTCLWSLQQPRLSQMSSGLPTPWGWVFFLHWTKSP